VISASMPLELKKHTDRILLGGPTLGLFRGFAAERNHLSSDRFCIFRRQVGSGRRGRTKHANALGFIAAC